MRSNILIPWALRPQLSRGRAGAPPRGWWPSGLASVSEAGGPGLGSSPLFCVAVSWFRAAGSCFVALPRISASSRGAASEVASRSAIARLNFPYYSSCYKNLLVKLFLQVETRSSGRRRNPAARRFSSIFKSLGLSARLRAVETAFFAARRSFS